MVSFGSCLSGMIAVVLISIYGYFFITHIRRPVYRDMRFLILLLLVAGIRMLLPLNLPINITIPNKGILVPISDVVFSSVPGTDIFLYKVINPIIFIVSMVMLVFKGIRYHRFKRAAEKFIARNDQLDKLLAARPLNQNSEKNTAYYTSAKVSPFVFDFLRPKIVIPDNIYNEEEINQILDHELTHINQKDLLLKATFNSLTAFFWWNPFIWLIQKQADTAIELSNDLSLFEKMDEKGKTDYASLLLKTARLPKESRIDDSLSLVTHSTPLIKRRVEHILDTTKDMQSHTLLPIHVMVMLLIVTVSFIITPEPYQIYDDQVGISFDMEEDLGASADNSYILDVGDHYELYIDGKYTCDFDEIVDEFKDYPVYTEKPDNNAETEDNTHSENDE